MLNSRILDYRIWVTLAISLIFGLALNVLLPLLSGKLLYVLALPIGFLFFALLVIKPKMILALMILTRPLLDHVLNSTKTNVGGDSIGIGAVLNIVIIVLAVFMAFYYSSFPRRNSAVLCWFIFLFFMLLASLYSPYIGRAIRLFFNYVSDFAMFLIPFLVIKSKDDFLFWLKIFAISFVFPIFFANIDLLRGGSYYPDAGMRIEGTFTHPNILAFYLVLGITVYFYILKSGYLNSRNGIKWIMRLLMLNMFILLVFTKSRNGWIACLVEFLIYALLKDRKLLMVLLLILPLSLAVPQVQDRVLSITHGKEANNYQGLNSFQWRVNLWKSSLPKIIERPIQGYGLTSFMYSSGNFTSASVNVGAHNTYLEVAFETGLVGLLSFLALYLTPLFIFFRRMSTAIHAVQAQLWAILVGYVISYLIICFADNLSYYLVLDWYVWFFIGLMVVVERVSLND